MKNLFIIDAIFFFSMLAIWLLLIINIAMLYYGYLFSEEIKLLKEKPLMREDLKEFPFVSIMIPAHNEEKVIGRTLKALIRLDYPQDRYEIIVINDNSKDETGIIIEEMKALYPKTLINHIQVIGERGGKGKSNALNIGYQEAKGEYLVIYDADNTPNKMSLLYLVHTIANHEDYGAVIGQFRTRNKDRNLLTKFINIETLSFQWMAQAGRWKLLGLCTIPGTNFIIRRSIIEGMGGWDKNAIAEDTEISLRIYNMGYKIAFMPLAITYEQEPETIPVWLKQRSRWVSGNIYVLFKHLLHPTHINSFRVIFDLFYYFSVYVLFLISIILSHFLFLMGIFSSIRVQVVGNFLVIWILSYLVFLLQISIALSNEKGEIHPENVVLIALMYFTYCQMWLVVSIMGIIHYLRSVVLQQGINWYKTERF